MTGIVKGTYILNLYVDSGEAWIAVDEAELLSVGIDYQKDLSAASKFRNEIIFLSVPKDSDVFFEALLSKNTFTGRSWLSYDDQPRELPKNYLQDAVFARSQYREINGFEALLCETAEDFFEELRWCRSCGQKAEPNA